MLIYLLYLHMSPKEKITNKFNKSNFALLNDGRDIPVQDNDWEGIDFYIRDFIKELNNSSHILTLYSCEGHKENDDAYLFFNVDETGWDIFWNKVLPELSYRFCFINPKIHDEALYQLQWQLSMHDTVYSTGISLHAQLLSFSCTNQDGVTKIIAWENKKERFWNTMKEVFLKHYN